MNILYVVADNEREWNSAEWRCAIPYRTLTRTKGQSTAMITLDAFADSYKEHSMNAAAVIPADVIFLQRQLILSDVVNAARYWRGAGKCVVLDLDDHYLELASNNPAWGFWNTPGANGKRNIDVMREYVASGVVDAVTSPNTRIVESWRKAGAKRAELLPNYAEGKRWVNTHKEPHIGFVLGWGGSFSHYDTWWRSGCALGLKLAQERRPDIRIVIWGSDWRVTGMIPARTEYAGKIPPDRIGEWPHAIAQFDVALAPLGGDYDQHRSWLHALEPMLCGVPWIGTAGDPWMELGKWGTLVDDSPEAWASAIVDMHDNYESYRHKAEEGRKQAWANTMESKVWEYLQVLERILLERRRPMWLAAGSPPPLPGSIVV